MPRFIATHTAPWTESGMKESAKDEPSKFPPGFSVKLTCCDFDDNKFFCEWEAPNKEAIEQVFKANNMPFDAIYPVQLFNVAKAELES